MALILVIDDLRSFPKFHAEHTVLYTRNAHDGVSLLSDLHRMHTPIDELWLDHDLGGTSIHPVVDWLCERCVWDDRPDIRNIYAHTSNPVGRGMILRTLSRWYPVTPVDALSAGAVVADPEK